MVYYVFLVCYFKKHFKPCFFHLKTFCSTLNWWIEEFVVSFFDFTNTYNLDLKFSKHFDLITHSIQPLWFRTSGSNSTVPLIIKRTNWEKVNLSCDLGSTNLMPGLNFCQIFWMYLSLPWRCSSAIEYKNWIALNLVALAAS